MATMKDKDASINSRNHTKAGGLTADQLSADSEDRATEAAGASTDALSGSVGDAGVAQGDKAKRIVEEGIA